MLLAQNSCNPESDVIRIRDKDEDAAKVEKSFYFVDSKLFSKVLLRESFEFLRMNEILFKFRRYVFD